MARLPFIHFFDTLLAAGFRDGVRHLPIYVSVSGFPMGVKIKLPGAEDMRRKTRRGRPRRYRPGWSFSESVAGERLDLACRLFSQGHVFQGAVLTGRSVRRPTRDRLHLSGAAVSHGVVTRGAGHD
jgi:hypothetical protein